MALKCPTKKFISANSVVTFLRQIFGMGSKPFQTDYLLILCMCYSYVQVLWELELAETHRGRAYEDCTADLQVDMIVGAVIEGVATCICRLISRTLSESNAKFGSVLDAFFGTMMVVAGKATEIESRSHFLDSFRDTVK